MIYVLFRGFCRPGQKLAAKLVQSSFANEDWVPAGGTHFGGPRPGMRLVTADSGRRNISISLIFLILSVAQIRPT